MSNLRINSAANYAGFVYATAISLAFMPLLHQLLGSESFGLVGIYVLLTNLLTLLDLGLATTVSRECAVHRHNPKSAGTLPHIIRISGFLFHALGVFLILAFILLPDSITFNWLNADQFSPASVNDYLLLILLAIIIRWISGLYRGVINGFEKQILASIIYALSATLRFPVAYALVLQSDDATKTYFQLQVGIAIFEYILLYLSSKHSTRKIKPASFYLIDLRRIFLRIFRLSLSISALIFITTLYIQIDKIILMRILPLAQFGDFSLIQTAITGIAALGGPLTTALIPRLTNIVANDKNSPHLFDEYIFSQQILLALMLPIGIICMLLAPKILFAWTGSTRFLTEMSVVFGIYAIGSSIWIISTIPTHLKYASGDINYLIKYNLVLILIYAPSSFFMGLKFGFIGTGMAWITVNVIAFIISHTIILQKFFSFQFWKRIIRDIFMASSISGILISLAYFTLPETESRFIATLQLLACFALSSVSIYFSISFFAKQSIQQKR